MSIEGGGRFWKAMAECGARERGDIFWRCRQSGSAGIVWPASSDTRAMPASRAGAASMQRSITESLSCPVFCATPSLLASEEQSSKLLEQPVPCWWSWTSATT
ncbi:hypothetical protein PVAP13_1NG327319 [Panicum virgatum]|uniref:Uncharacterized protein n=1 Tax=Panicum virgatum TaxID=38727 RepID=A0A8T0WR32_PANVG|nr:hypothetical protein PVAP13_1NG327319 [Panicum virgatum]